MRSQNGRAFVLLAAILLFAPQAIRAQMPDGFSWVNLESDKTTMATVRHALHDTSITAIREVGVENGFALVMAASRESGAPTPDFDSWTIYSISLTTGMSRLLVFGYGVRLLDWIGPNSSELAITYYSCWECEASKIFTTLHFKNGIGWMARWPSSSRESVGYPQPGVVVSYGDAGEPYDDDEVDQVFGIVSRPNGEFAVGSWFHSLDTKTGKVTDDVARYSIDPKTGQDQVAVLRGFSARELERQICTASDVQIEPKVGQDSKSCRRVLSKQKATAN